MTLQNDFEASDVLSKPLMAYLALVEDGAPRSSHFGFYTKTIESGYLV